MLETREERVKLLKAGIDGRTIEELYIKYNSIKIIAGVFSGRNIEGLFSKTMTSCMECTFFKIVDAEGQVVSI